MTRALPLADYSLTGLFTIFVADDQAVARGARMMKLKTAVASKSRIEARVYHLSSTALIGSVNLHHCGFALLVVARSDLVLVEDQLVDLALLLPVRTEPLGAVEFNFLADVAESLGRSIYLRTLLIVSHLVAFLLQVALYVNLFLIMLYTINNWLIKL